MNELDDYKDEIIEKIAVEYPALRNSRMSEFKQIFGGTDTTIYGFDLVSDSLAKWVKLLERYSYLLRPNAYWFHHTISSSMG